MILRTRGADVEQRSARPFNVEATRIPGPGWGSMAYSGKRVTVDSAVGVPSVLRAFTLVSETIAGLPCRIYSGRGSERRERDTSPMWRFLHDAPNSEMDAFTFWCDVNAHMESYGNAFIRKIKVRGRVEELWPIEPWMVRVYRDQATQEKRFEVFDGSTLSTADVLHVPGFRVRGSLIGQSRIALARHALGAALSLEEFSGGFFARGAAPSVVLSVPGSLTQESADALQSRFSATHAGSWNSHRPAILSDGATITPMGMSLQDAQFIEAHRFSVEEMARIVGVPVRFLGAQIERQTTEQDSLLLLNFSLLPRMRRFEKAFSADVDLFPPQLGEYPQFFADEFLRTDAATQAEVAHKKVQSGIWLVDEARAFEGLAPLPNGAGQIPQITPVGGAPNPNVQGGDGG